MLGQFGNNAPYEILSQDQYGRNCIHICSLAASEASAEIMYKLMTNFQIHAEFLLKRDLSMLDRVSPRRFYF